ncbi:MAG: nitroreductase family protein [Thermodesulfovibrionales bacterium]
MDTMQAIFTRRSIRHYTHDPVTQEKLDAVLRAAMFAPSAGNQRPWHFVVITGRKTLDQIPSFHPHSLMVKEAVAAVLVCGDPTLEKHQGYWVQDCAAATENLLLAAHANGLGSVWVGVYPREERMTGFRKLLNIPDHVMPFALAPLGFPAEEKQQPDRYQPDRIHTDGW